MIKGILAVKDLYYPHLNKHKLYGTICVKFYMFMFTQVMGSYPFKIFNGLYVLTLFLIKMPFNAFANRADPDQAALVRAA